MNTCLIDGNWNAALTQPLRGKSVSLRIVCPFIQLSALKRLLSHNPQSLQVITRFNLNDFVEGVSDIEALRHVIKVGGRVRGIKGLHSKLYLFGDQRAIVASANLTCAALNRNQELGVASDDATMVAACHQYFELLWGHGEKDLTLQDLNDWVKLIAPRLQKPLRPGELEALGDFGATVKSDKPVVLNLSPKVNIARQAFVKFLGEAKGRVSLSYPVLEEVERSGCHWAVAYPRLKRPRSISDGDIIFIGRLTSEPNDIRVFGRAIGMRHYEGRDDATAAEITSRPWKKTWPHYIRVHHAEFVSGTLENAVSLNELMDALGADSFRPTQENALKGLGNTDPRKAYRQQASVALSDEGQAWLAEQLQAAFDRYGKIPDESLERLDWPDVP